MDVRQSSAMKAELRSSRESQPQELSHLGGALADLVRLLRLLCARMLNYVLRASLANKRA